MSTVDTLIAEILTKLINPLKTADQKTLEVKLVTDAHIDIHISAFALDLNGPAAP